MRGKRNGSRPSSADQQRTPAATANPHPGDDSKTQATVTYQERRSMMNRSHWHPATMSAGFFPVRPSPACIGGIALHHVGPDAADDAAVGQQAERGLRQDGWKILHDDCRVTPRLAGVFRTHASGNPQIRLGFGVAIDWYEGCSSRSLRMGSDVLHTPSKGRAPARVCCSTFRRSRGTRRRRSPRSPARRSQDSRLVGTHASLALHLRERCFPLYRTDDAQSALYLSGPSIVMPGAAFMTAS